MAKLTKKELKSLLKECILEIFSEENIIPSLKESYAPGVGAPPMLQQRYAQPQPGSRAAASDIVAPNNQAQPQNVVNPLVQEHVTAIAGALGKSGKDAALYESLLADTAANTFQKMQADPEFRNGSAGMSIPEYVSPEQAEKDKSEMETLVAGKDINRWAQVAFAKKQ